jgi:hypothetical protein
MVKGGAMQNATFVRDISTPRIFDAEEAGDKGANMGELGRSRPCAIRRRRLR